MPTKLQILRDMSADLGFVRDISQVPAEFDCPVHDIPIIEHHVETISGWHGLYVCPSYAGDCSYGPDGDPMAIEPPVDPDQETEQAPKSTRTTPSKPANQGGF